MVVVCQSLTATATTPELQVTWGMRSGLMEDSALGDNTPAPYGLLW